MRNKQYINGVLLNRENPLYEVGLAIYLQWCYDKNKANITRLWVVENPSIWGIWLSLLPGKYV